MSKTVEFSLEAVDETIKANLEKMLLDIQDHYQDNSDYVIIPAHHLSLERLVELADKHGLINQIKNQAIGAHNVLRLISPVITQNLPLHPEIGITVNGNLVSMLLDAQSIKANEFLDTYYFNEGYTADPIPVPVVKDHQVLEVVTTYGVVLGWNTVFRTYSNGDNGVQVELSDLPIIRSINGWVDYNSILGWKYPTEKAVADFKTKFQEHLESPKDVVENQMNQVEKWILFDDGLYQNQSIGEGDAPEERLSDLDRGETMAVDVPLTGDSADTLRGLVSGEGIFNPDNAQNLNNELLSHVDTDRESDTVKVGLGTLSEGYSQGVIATESQLPKDVDFKNEYLHPKDAKDTDA